MSRITLFFMAIVSLWALTATVWAHPQAGCADWDRPNCIPRPTAPAPQVKAKPAPRKTRQVVAASAPAAPPPAKTLAKSPAQKWYRLGVTPYLMLLDERGIEEADTDAPVARPVSLTNEFHFDEQIRLLFEAPQAGFIYVLNHELFKGTRPPTYRLLFPTASSPDNRTRAGKPFYVPSAPGDGRTLVFTRPAETQSADYLGENIIVIWSPFQLSNLPPLQAKFTPLVEKDVKRWLASAQTFTSEHKNSPASALKKNQARRSVLYDTDDQPGCVAWIKAQAGRPLMLKFPLTVTEAPESLSALTNYQPYWKR